ncbi:hypothetical protein M408DRAFT_25116 [Serendipita vermifera MAFF 305830]|uniref:F-box domain-containing protein n=1 Tax=Serendipita vermifera MAFF 305830 TaxID=933852 RepID=A0A0C3B5U8_SERVB|nr:hypothetical protein M408DRAFT_25116 [Serendipita vermifera MAFF 305830]
MIDSALDRAPFEIWERILLEVVNGTLTPIFDVTCTSSNYLAFKRTCGDGSVVHQDGYIASEKDRVTIRYVCRAWRITVDRWDNRERWIRISTGDGHVSWERWKGAQRIELTSRVKKRRHNGNGPSMYQGDRFSAVLSDWRSSYLITGCSMQVKRLEMLHLNEIEFKRVVEALCNASQALVSLRSLSLSIPVQDEYSLRMISIHFPKLTHLTLRFAVYPASTTLSHPPQEQGAAIHFRTLEVLFLICIEGCYRFSNWVIPALRHLNIRANTTLLEGTIIPFIRYKASNVETLDLEDLDEAKKWGTNQPKSTGRLLAISRLCGSTVNFWDMFPQLRLLRCKLGRSAFSDCPDIHHPLDHIVHSTPITSVDDMFAVLGPWLYNDQVKRLKSIVLFGPYLFSGACIKEGHVDLLLRELRSSGIRLVNPAGRSWMDADIL